MNHEKDDFNKHLRSHVLQCRSWFKCWGSSASSALKTEKKLNATNLKILICMAHIFTTSQQHKCAYSSSNFRKLIYKICLSWLTVFHTPLLFFGNWKDWPCWLEKIPRLWWSTCKFFVKNAVLGISRWRKPQFSTWGLLFIFCSWNLSKLPCF